MGDQPTRPAPPSCRAAGCQTASRGATLATLAAVVGGGALVLVAAGADSPARSRRAAIVEALAAISPGAAAWLVAVEWRANRRAPTIRIVRRLRPGHGAAAEAAAVLLGAFHGPPAPMPEAKHLRPPGRPAKPPEPVPGEPEWLPRWLRPRAPRRRRRS